MPNKYEKLLTIREYLKEKAEELDKYIQIDKVHYKITQIKIEEKLIEYRDELSKLTKNERDEYLEIIDKIDNQKTRK